MASTFFPVFDDDFFFIRAQVNRLTFCECGIEFFDVISRDVFFSTRREMIAHHSRERIDQHLERFTVVIDRMIFSLDGILEKFDNFLDVRRTTKRVHLISRHIDAHVGDTHERM